jgi:hypothetical protein
MSDNEHREAEATDGDTTASRGGVAASAVASSWLPSLSLSLAFSAAC